MQHHNDVPKQSSVETLSQPKIVQQFLPLPALVAVAVLALATLACAFIETNSRSVADSIVITRLPTLTPTAMSTPMAAATSVETAILTPTPVVSLNSTAVPVAVVAPSEASAATPTLPVNTPVTLVDASAVNPTVAPIIPVATIATAIPSPTSTPTVTATPLPTDTPMPTATPTPQAWVFSGVRLYPNPYDDGLLLYGNLVNNTSTAQKLTSVLGTFYDTQNQVIAGPESSESYWPAYVVAPGAGMPFEVNVDAIDNAADFDLNVAAEPSDEIPRQDFEFLDLNQSTDEDSYCVRGELRNPGGELQDYLVIALVLYDSQENIISFSYYEELAPDWIEGDEILEFELCSDLLNQTVARHALQAWGR